MTIDIIVFAVSGVLIALFLALKAYQVRYAKIVMIPRLRERFELRLVRVGRGVAWVRSKINHKTPYVMLHSVLVQTKKIAVMVYRNVDQLAHTTMRRIHAETQQPVERTRSL